MTVASGAGRSVAARRATTLVLVLVAGVLGYAGWAAWTSGASAAVLGDPSRWPHPDGDAGVFGMVELLVFAGAALLSPAIVLERPVGRATGLGLPLVAAAALLGASPMATATVALAAVVGAVAKDGRTRRAELGISVAAAWVLPPLLQLATQVDAGALGMAGAVPVVEMLLVTLLVVVGLPALEVLETRLLAAPERHLDFDDVLVANVQVQAVLAAIAILTAMTYVTLGPLSALVMALPIGAARIGFRRHRRGEESIEQTLSAMARLPEWVHAVDHDHARRVAEAAVQASLRMGHGSSLRRDLEFAARLHELGHLDRGAEADDRERIATSGAAVLEQAGVSPRVAAIVRAAGVDTPRSAHEDDVAGAVVGACCALDRRARITDPAVAGAMVAGEITSATRLHSTTTRW